MSVNKPFKRTLLSLAVSALLAAPGLSNAQSPEQDEDPDQMESERQSAGIYSHDFRFLPQVSLTALYNDNVFAESSDEQSDLVMIVAPSMTMRSNWDKHSLNIRMGAEISRYRDYIAENYEDHFLDVRGRYYLPNNDYLFAGIGTRFEHEGRDSPDDDLSGINPTTYTSNTLHLGMQHLAERYSTRLALAFEDLDYDNVSRAGGTLINDDRNRQVSDIGVRVNVPVATDMDVFLQTIYNRTQYDDRVDQNGYDRDSDGYRLNIGLKTQLSQVTQLEAFAGVLYRDYDDPRFGDLSKPDFSAKLVYVPSAELQIGAKLNRALYETTLSGSAGYLYSSLDIFAEKRVAPRIYGNMKLAYGEADYLNIPLEDEYSSASIGLKYYLDQYLYLAADYQYRTRDSNDQFGIPVTPGFSQDYDNNLWLLSLGFHPYPKEDPRISDTELTGTVEIGASYVEDDSTRFGRYNGLDEKGLHLIGNIDALAHNKGRDYTRFRVQDAGLDTRELMLSWGALGSYNAYFSYDESVHRQFTGLSPFNGIGTSSLTLASDWFDNTPPLIDETTDMDKLDGDLQSVEFGTERTGLGAGANLFVLGPWSLSVDFRSETKEGLQPIGGVVGHSPGNSRVALLPQPVDYQDDQLNGEISYTGDKGQASLAYHASLFTNSQQSLNWESPYSSNPPGSRYSDGSLAQAPDNEFHQLALSGNYILPMRSQISGLYSVGRMTQDAAFLPYTINPTYASPLPRDSLDGKVDLQNAQIRITSRPLRRLSLNAGYRLHERDSDTAQTTYNYVWADSQNSDPPRQPVATNTPYDYQQQITNLDARYRVNRQISVAAGAEREEMERSPAQVEETTDDRYHLKVRVNPLDNLEVTLQGSVSNRNGSNYQSNPEENPLLRKYHMADRDQDAASISISYQPIDRLSLSFSAQRADDEYGDSDIGLTAADQSTYTLDASLQIAEDTHGYVFYSRDEISSDQAGSTDGINDPITPDWQPDWFAEYEDTHDSIGLGLARKHINDNLDVGVDYVYSHTESDIRFIDNNTVLAKGSAFPELSNDIQTLRLYADYQFKKNTQIRFNYIHEEYESDDWSLDGLGVDGISNVLTLGEESPNYSIDYLGVSLQYRF